ncbi:MAG TPA: CHASE2 domain-containing protein [Xanthomonadaceae bacterium]|nr:CHASE2 domain-containing protein [Xanthomonadaceae bacterium]
MLKRVTQRVLSWFEAGLARLGQGFIVRWERIERSYRRPNAQIALRLGFAFYPLLAIAALSWLAWDWTHDRELASAENAIFDTVIQWRPWEPVPSRQVAVVEIDECSINHYLMRGEGGWPWSRQRHADLLDALDRAGVRTVGFDIQFTDRSAADPLSDLVLEQMAEGGKGRFVFGATRLHEDYDADSENRVSDVPFAFPLVAEPRRDPKVALLFPYGRPMQQNAALLNVTRNVDGVLRDVPLREEVGDWALPSLALRLAAGPDPAKLASYPDTIRIDWRTRTRLPGTSAANLLEGRHVCGDADAGPLDLRGKTVLVGYTAAGLNDAKPTPVDPTMAGVEVHAEATEALLANRTIWMPPAWVKYLLAALLVALTGLAFFRGEPAWELDSLFVAANLALMLLAFIGLSAFGVFFDIFAAMGFVALCFGACRVYAATQRRYAIGNDDYRPGFDPERHPWVALARVRFVPDRGLDRKSLETRLREFRRRLRRFLYRGTEAVAMDCVVEYDSWFWDSMVDVTVLLWGGTDRDAVVATAQRELDALHARLAGHEELLPDDGSVRVACVVARVADDDEETECVTTARIRVCEALGEVLRAPRERPLRAQNAFEEV